MSHKGPKPPACLNCHHPLEEHDQFCARCGQRAIYPGMSLHDLFHELVHTKLHLDGIFFRTLKHLFVPGKLTQQYLKGHMAAYTHPFRLFLVLASLSFAAMTIAFKKGDSETTKVFQNLKLTGIHYTVLDDLEKLSLESGLPEGKSLGPMYDSISQIGQYLRQDDNTLDSSEDRTININLTPSEGIKLDPFDLYYMPYDSIWKKYGITGFTRKIFFKQSIKLLRSGQSPLGKTTKNFFWATLIITPIFAAWLLLIYRRRKMFYNEHLIFVYHFHSLYYLLIIPMFLFSKWLPDWIYAILAIYLTGYLLVSMKRIYGQGWPKTLLKGFIAFLGYTIISSLITLITVFISFLLF